MSLRTVLLRRRGRAAALLAGPLALAGLALSPSAGSADLQGSLDAATSRAGALQSGIRADQTAAAGFQGKISDLQARLSALESTLAVERRQLDALQVGLRAARTRLAALQIALANDRIVLAQQLRAQYETPQADIVSVVLDAKGFADLLERVSNLQAIGRRDAQTFAEVRRQGRVTAAQAAHLAVLEARQQTLTNAILVQRNEVAQARLAVVSRQLVYVRAGARKQAELSALNARRQRLQARLAALSAAAAGAFPSSGAGTALGGAPALGGAVGDFAGHGGSDGFFPAPGTNYAVGEEPQIAARLDQLGLALHLHLIGISGYRSPQHSVEVGGFANDPHTQGRASDTPGVEGVPEATLNRFGLTRPFPGPAEADHIQLLGG